MPDPSRLHCLHCGTRLIWRELDNRIREVCPACGWIQYHQLKVGAGAVVARDGCLLLLKRAHDPWKGTWNLPAGYVEADEDPARAAERETFEETGLQVRAEQLLDAFYFDDDPRGNGVLLIYRCEIVRGKARVSSESTELSFFETDAIPEDLAGAGHARTIRKWQRPNK